LLAKLQEIEWGKNKYGRGPRLSGKGKALASMLFRLVLVVVVDVRHTFSRSTEKGSIKKTDVWLCDWCGYIFCMPVNFPFPEVDAYCLFWVVVFGTTSQNGDQPTVL